MMTKCSDVAQNLHLLPGALIKPGNGGKLLADVRICK